MEKRKTKTDSITIISDPLIEPFYISKDPYCYTLFESVNSSESDKQYQKSVGHYIDFGSCLKVIAQLKAEKKESFSSIKEYINEWNKRKIEFKTLIEP